MEEDENDEEEDNKGSEEEEKEEYTNNNTGKKKKATYKTLDTITEDYNNVLAFLQAVEVKSLQVTAAPLFLRADKRARIWFQQWSGNNLNNPDKTAPRDHPGLTGVLIKVSTKLQNT